MKSDIFLPYKRMLATSPTCSSQDLMEDLFLGYLISPPKKGNLHVNMTHGGQTAELGSHSLTSVIPSQSRARHGVFSRRRKWLSELEMWVRW